MRIRQRNNCIEIRTPAKINLCLDVLGRRTDGYHELDTIISPISLFDTLQFTPRRDSEFRLSLSSVSNRKGIPLNDSNLIIKALSALRERVGREVCGFDICLTKRIPSPAGLGGGSSNAAGAILIANSAWDVGWDAGQLAEVGSLVGSDVPCFFFPGLTRCRGRGERVEQLACRTGPIYIVLVSPKSGLSTVRVFQQRAAMSGMEDGSQREFGAKKMLSAIEGGRIRDIASSLSNGLTAAARSLCREIAECADAFEKLSECLGHQMSGSGTSYFGIFPSQKAANAARRKLMCRLSAFTVSCAKTLTPFLSQEFPRRQEMDRSVLCE